MAIQSIDRKAVWLDEASADISVLRELTGQVTEPESVPLATTIVRQIPVYEGPDIRAAAVIQDTAPQRLRAYQQEWARVLDQGAGIVLVRNAFDDVSIVDAVSEVFSGIIDEERRSGTGADHFSARGNNTRIWNAHEKLCMASPELFARYNANDTLQFMCLAWLGPGYQITAQGNIVHPGGKAQTCHRDYHMGFQRPEQLYQYPAHVHGMTPMLTLQGAIAHSDMPLESGPTKLLPFSQQFLPGYLASSRPDCVDLFESSHVQVPLYKGDMLFFNPALMHAAGDNLTSDVERFANLVQVGSIYGRTMEYLDRTRMSIALYPVLQRLAAEPSWPERSTRQVIEACAEAYPFPANMELEPPLDGLAPPSQQAVMRQCLAEGSSGEEFARQMASLAALKRSH